MNENPYSSPAESDSPPDLQFKPKFFKAWIIFLIIASIGGGVAGGMAGMVAGLLLSGSGFTQQQMFLIGQGLGLLVSLPISFLTYRWSVKEFILSDLERSRS